MADAVARRERQALMDRAAAVVQQEAEEEERRRRKAKEQAAAYAAYINGLRVSEGGSAYSIGKQIGVGAYGAVHIAVHRATGTHAAYKIVNTYSGIPGQTMRELAALKTLVHENIVTLQNVEHIRGYGIGAPYKLAMALDLARCDLLHYIKQGGETRVAVGVDKARVSGGWWVTVVVSDDVPRRLPPPPSPHSLVTDNHVSTVERNRTRPLPKFHPPRLKTREFAHRQGW